METKEPTVQLNIAVPASVRDQLKADAKAFGKTLDATGAIIMQTFFAMKKVERGLVYRNVKNKVFGRPL